MIPKYKVGKCIKCKEFIWVDEDCYAVIMGRLREISNKEYSQYVLGGYLTIPILEAGKCLKETSHTIIMVGREKSNSKITYVNEIDVLKD